MKLMQKRMDAVPIQTEITRSAKTLMDTAKADWDNRKAAVDAEKANIEKANNAKANDAKSQRRSSTDGDIAELKRLERAYDTEKSTYDAENEKLQKAKVSLHTALDKASKDRAKNFIGKNVSVNPARKKDVRQHNPKSNGKGAKDILKSETVKYFATPSGKVVKGRTVRTINQKQLPGFVVTYNFPKGASSNVFGSIIGILDTASNKAATDSKTQRAIEASGEVSYQYIILLSILLCEIYSFHNSLNIKTVVN